MRRLFLPLACLALLALAGCGSLNPFRSHIYSEPEGASPDRTSSVPEATTDAKTKPYTVLGRTYYPLQTADGYDEVGLASWYGSDFHGRKTANGQIYDMYGLSAAHKTLPLGTRVRVTNLSNNQSVALVINDRGPFVSGRILDLSYGAARDLGLVDKGVGKVRISAIGTTTAPEAVTAKAVQYYHVRVGAFAVRANAERARTHLINQGYKDASILVEDRDGTILHIVVAGSFTSRDKAERVQERLKRSFPTCYIIG